LETDVIKRTMDKNRCARDSRKDSIIRVSRERNWSFS